MGGENRGQKRESFEIYRFSLVNLVVSTIYATAKNTLEKTGFWGQQRRRTAAAGVPGMEAAGSLRRGQSGRTHVVPHRAADRVRDRAAPAGRTAGSGRRHPPHLHRLHSGNVPAVRGPGHDIRRTVGLLGSVLPERHALLTEDVQGTAETVPPAHQGVVPATGHPSHAPLRRRCPEIHPAADGSGFRCHSAPGGEVRQ